MPVNQINSGGTYTLRNVGNPKSVLDLSGENNRSSMFYLFPVGSLFDRFPDRNAVIGYESHGGNNQKVGP
jgi:hypothetical protein